MGGEMKKRGEGEGKCKNLESNYTEGNMVNFHPQCGEFPFFSEKFSFIAPNTSSLDFDYMTLEL